MRVIYGCTSTGCKHVPVDMSQGYMRVCVSSCVGHLHNLSPHRSGTVKSTEIKVYFRPKSKHFSVILMPKLHKCCHSKS